MLTRRRLRRLGCWIVVAVLVGATGAVSTGPASGVFAQPDEDCWRWVEVIVDYDESGNPVFGSRLTNICGSGNGSGGGGGANSCRHPTYGEFDCYSSTRGSWSSSRSCYIMPTRPQPAAGDERWEGHSPDEGAVYTVSCPLGPQSESNFDLHYEFLTQPPVQPDPVVLAQQVLGRLPIANPVIGIAPAPEGTGLVGVWVWLWVENADAGWGPVGPECVTLGITVCGEAEVTDVLWRMGDGQTVECEDAGTPYRAEYGAEKPDCGHLYLRPSSTVGGRYEITVETFWRFDWWVSPQGSDATGSEVLPARTASTSIQVNELQVVTS